MNTGKVISLKIGGWAADLLEMSADFKCVEQRVSDDYNAEQIQQQANGIEM
ncbi:hypothetical protein HLH44_18675 [Gluconacetobacter sp. 1c LMG 22058]|uniref:Uncharacterized protein n=1 Tax=Gluconacetobacter dulcium TaxID=2729096 RepID=A0A7W4PKB2_9PROT|nr:hypothetical protein [Gluconacetobacter dulcium]MBB2199434.1 hypothetical protein [Gluconacetobacter dulcium]